MDREREAALVRSAQTGDRAAFLELARHHAPPLYRLSFALTLDHDNAMALTVEAFKRAHTGIGHSAPGKRFFPWVLRIARNLVVTQSRRQAGQPPPDRLRGLPETPAAQSPASLGTPNERRIIEGLRNLRPGEQMALALRIVERHPYGEIAELLDQPLRMTMARLAGARGALLPRDVRTGETGDGIHLTLQQLSAFIDGELPEASTAIVQRHLSVCEGCVETFGRLEEQEAVLERVLTYDLATRTPRAEEPPPREVRKVHLAWWVGLVAVLLALSATVVVMRAPLSQLGDLRARVMGTRPEMMHPLAPASLSPRGTNDPMWLEESVANVERMAAEAERTSSAEGFDVAGRAWATILPRLIDSPEDVKIGRFEMAKVRLRAWEIDPTPQRGATAESAVQACIRETPAGPDRNLAAAWLAKLRQQKQ